MVIAPVTAVVCQMMSTAGSSSIMNGDVAEREGFEPSIRFWRILTFQASAFDHSATAPHALEGVRPSGMKGVPQAGCSWHGGNHEISAFDRCHLHRH